MERNHVDLLIKAGEAISVMMKTGLLTQHFWIKGTIKPTFAFVS